MARMHAKYTGRRMYTAASKQGTPACIECKDRVELCRDDDQVAGDALGDPHLAIIY